MCIRNLVNSLFGHAEIILSIVKVYGVPLAFLVLLEVQEFQHEQHHSFIHEKLAWNGIKPLLLIEFNKGN